MLAERISDTYVNYAIMRIVIIFQLCAFVRPSVRPKRNVRISTQNKSLDLETLNVLHICTLIGHIRLPSKSSLFLTFIFKVKYSNGMHWQVHNVCVCVRVFVCVYVCVCVTVWTPLRSNRRHHVSTVVIVAVLTSRVIVVVIVILAIVKKRHAFDVVVAILPTVTIVILTCVLTSPLRRRSDVINTSLSSCPPSAFHGRDDIALSLTIWQKVERVPECVAMPVPRNWASKSCNFFTIHSRGAKMDGHTEGRRCHNNPVLLMNLSALSRQTI